MDKGVWMDLQVLDPVLSEVFKREKLGRKVFDPRAMFRLTDLDGVADFGFDVEHELNDVVCTTGGVIVGGQRGGCHDVYEAERDELSCR